MTDREVWDQIARFDALLETPDKNRDELRDIHAKLTAWMNEQPDQIETMDQYHLIQSVALSLEGALDRF
ncbi:MAG: hypothetical protein AAFV59_07520 [Pseudomonadota bacterium]